MKPTALGNAFALSTIILYLAFYILKFISPTFFKLLLNSQLMGADIASQIPKGNFANFLGILIAVGSISWIFGYLLARLYNRFI